MKEKNQTPKSFTIELDLKTSGFFIEFKLKEDDYGIV
jgi:hypothetical protein